MLNDGIVRFRRSLIIRQQDAARAAEGGEGGRERDSINSSRPSLARAPSFDEPAGGVAESKDVSLQWVESGAIAALSRRDRVRTQDTSTSIEMPKEYSSNSSPASVPRLREHSQTVSDTF